MAPTPRDEPTFPCLRRMGFNGLLVSFAAALSEPANRAALAFRAAVDGERWPEVEETTASLASTFLRFDPLRVAHDEIEERLRALLRGSDWYAAPLPAGRRFWRIPTVYGTELAPQFAEAAAAAGVSEDVARAELSAARVRIMTIGFTPGMPYLGELPERWNLPRQTQLNPRVPVGALVLAIRQFVLFSSASPTGWRHVGQTAFRGFRPEFDPPFLLSPGDEVSFVATPREAFEALRAADTDGTGGAASEPIE